MYTQIPNVKTNDVEKKLSQIKFTILEVIRKYQKLEKDFMLSKFNLEPQIHMNKFDIAVEVIEDQLKLCDLDLKVLEVEKKKHGSGEGESVKKIEELEEKLEKALEEVSKQKEIQKKMELTFKESKQKRIEHMKILLEELRKYLSQLDTLNVNETEMK